MELSPCLLLLLLFCSTYSNKIIEDEHQGPMLPRFTWLDNYNIMVSFPNGVEDTIKLRPADKIGNMIVPCLYEGVLLQDNSSSVAVSGCRHDDLVHIVLNHNMFNINNGTTEEVEKIDFDKSNTRVGRKNKRRLKKRGAYLDDDDDYDEEAFDGSDPPTPPPFLSLQVRFAFEESLLAEKKTEVAAREYIARVFTLGKHHFQHTSLGTKIRLKAQGPIRRIHDKSWNPSSVDLKEARKYKDPENIPITFFCYNQNRENDVGISYIRRACHEEKGLAIVAARDDINKAAQSYSHETAHWLGLPHDLDSGLECEGQGIMSRIDTPGGRPSKWSHCNERKFNKWFYHDNKKFSKCLREDEEILQMESSCLATSYETVVTSTPKCDIVIVSGADYDNCNGEYQVSAERVPWSPSRPVYAHVSEDRYIFWNVRGHGWSIGNKEDLQTGSYFHYSGLDSSEPWEASWRNNITVQCKLGVILLESEGLTADYDGMVMGYFDELPEKFNERPAYVQRGRTVEDFFIFYDGVNDWWVSKELGLTVGWLHVKSDSLLPPTSGWRFYAGSRFGWLEAAVNDTSLKLTHNPSDLGDCNRINVSATGPVVVKYKEHLGLYKWMSGEILNGRKLYHNGHAYLRIRTGQSAWRTGGLKDDWLSSGSLTSGKGTNCPCSITAGPSHSYDREWWAYWENSKWNVDMSIALTCV